MIARAFVAALALLLAAGCASPPQAPAERVVLLPNPDASPSAVVVKRDATERVLAKPYEGVELSGAEVKPFTSSAEDVERRYGALLKTLPARPMSANVYFAVGSAELTEESRSAAKTLVSNLKSYSAPQLSLTGHTDATGAAAANEALSKQRAEAVRAYLIELGVPADAMELSWRGARDPAVKVDARQAEQLDRRVEIRLR